MTRYALLSAVLATSFAGAALAAPIIIDNGDPGTVRMGDGFYGNSTDGDGRTSYGGDYSWANQKGAGNTAYYAWQFSGITPGEYEVYVTWSVNRPNWQSTNSSVTYYVVDGAIVARDYDPYRDMIPADGASILDFPMVDQSVNPSGFDYNDHPWVKLGNYTISNNALSVFINNETPTAGTIVADAVMIIPVPEPAALGLLGSAAMLVLGRRRG